MDNLTGLSDKTTRDNTVFGTWTEFLWDISFTSILAHLVLGAFLIANFIVNLRVIRKMRSSSDNERMRSGSLRFLIAQVAVMSIVVTVTTLYLTVGQLGWIQAENLPNCGLKDFMKTVLNSALSINLTAIFNNQARNFDGYLEISELSIYCVFFLVWIPTIIQGLPGFLLTTYFEENSNNRCVLVDSFGNLLIFESLEIVKLLVSVGLSAYMIKVLLSIRSEFRRQYRYLPNAQRRRENQILTTRFLCVHLITFLSLWLTLVVVVSIIRIIGAYLHRDILIESVYTDLILFTYLTLNSWINMTLADNKMHVWPGWIHGWCVCLEERSPEYRDVERHYDDMRRPALETIRTREMTRDEGQRFPSISGRSTNVVSISDIASASRVMMMMGNPNSRLQSTVVNFTRMG